MSQEILMPFGLYPGGGVVTTKDPNVQVEQHIASLITTQPGERVMISQYGVATSRYVFEPNDETISTQLVSEVTAAINTWEPNVIVKTVTPVPNSSVYGIANVQVEFAQGTTALLGQTYTATVLVGGTVVGDPVTS
jgi:phage baseplate assembly protein W